MANTYPCRAVACTLLSILTLLIGCARPYRTDAIGGWGRAMINEDYAVAHRYVTSGNVKQWQEDTEQLAQQHGGIRSYQRGYELPSDGQGPVAIITLTWEDGYQRCIYLRETNDQSIAVIEGYRDCNGIATPP
jgi:hypothetical protein